MSRWRLGKPARGAKPPVLKVKKLDDKAVIPTRGSAKSAGLDLYATHPVTLAPGDIRQVHTGIAAEIPDGYFGHLVTRSSLGSIGIRIASGASVIDSDYRGEILLYVINDGAYPYTIKHGDRCAQMVSVPYLTMTVEVVNELSETTRGKGGFGSTGK